MLTLIKTICFNNIPVIIRLLKPGIRLNNIVYEILILLVKELLLNLKNLGINIISGRINFNSTCQKLWKSAAKVFL